MRDANGPQTVFRLGFRGQGVVEHFAVFRHSQRWPEFTIRECHHQRRKDEDAQQHGKGEKQTQHGQYGQQAKLYVRSEEPLHERTIRAEDFYCLQIPVA